MSKPITIIILVLFALFSFGSCKKSTGGTVIAESLYIPWNLDSLMPANTAYLTGIPISNVTGVMVACKISGNLADTSGDSILYTRNWEAAQFTGSVNAVSVNSIPLGIGYTQIFDHYDSVSVWNDTALNHWNVSGAGSIPSISADVPGAMPVYTGSLPVSIATGSGFSFTFNSSNTLNGDSAFVVVYGGGNDFAGYIVLSNVVSANGGSATISAEKLSLFQNGYFTLNGQSPGGTVYFGGLIMLVIFNRNNQTFADKQFAFIKQREVLGQVHFL